MKFNDKINDFIKTPTYVHFSLQPVEILKYFVVNGHQQNFSQKTTTVHVMNFGITHIRRNEL